ncbi:MAG: hypothetical protein E4H09_03275 [Spirochaetales bacterium]|nr:MAG: hypothetical protein E4H09_03275 [Spirochaetales bacterium]
MSQSPQTPAYHVVIHDDTWEAIGRYARDLEAGTARPGERMRRVLEDPKTDGDTTPMGVLQALLDTKRPRIYAESEVTGDGTDWTAGELSLLGDIAVAVPVTVFDDGLHAHPVVHEVPFRGTLLYVPGALLRNDRGGEPPRTGRWCATDASTNQRTSNCTSVVFSRCLSGQGDSLSAGEERPW